MKRQSPGSLTLAQEAARFRWVELSAIHRPGVRAALHAVHQVAALGEGGHQEVLVTKCGCVSPVLFRAHERYLKSRACPDCLLAIADAAGIRTLRVR